VSQPNRDAGLMTFQPLGLDLADFVEK
jgi:hypothetical protein